MLSAFRPVRAAARALAVQQRAIATAADSDNAAAAAAVAALCSCRTHAAAAAASPSPSSSSTVAAHSMCAVCARAAWRPAAAWSCAPLQPHLQLHMSARAFSTLRTMSVRSLQPQSRAGTLRITAARFSTAAPKAEQAAAGAQDAGAAGAKAGAEGEGAKNEGADAGAGFSEQSSGSSGSAPQFEEQTVKRRNWPKTIGKILLGAGAIWGIMNYSSEISSYVLNHFFLHNLREKGVAAVPSLEESPWSWSLLRPELLAQFNDVRNTIAENPKLLNELIDAMAPPGLEKGPLGVGADAFDLAQMARAQWVLSLLLGCTDSGRDIRFVEALRAAHRRSKRRQEAFIANFAKEEEARFARETAERAVLVSQTFSEMERDPVLSKDKKALAARKKEYLAGFSPIVPARKDPEPTAVPMTLMQILVRHGLHRLPKETANDYAEQWKATKIAEMRAAEEAAAARRRQEGLPSLPAADEAANDAAGVKKLEEKMNEKAPFFRALIDGGVERTLSINAWTLLKVLVEPSVPGVQHTYGGELAEHCPDRALLAKGEGVFLDEHEATVRELRKELVQSLLVFAFFLAPPAPGVVPIWGAEGLMPATELLGTLLFDIPDLTATAKRVPEATKGALFSAMANLGAVYQQENCPGAAVRAMRHVLEIDPMNHGVMTQLAVELIKLGQLQQTKEAGKKAVEAAKVDPAAAAAIAAAVNPAENPRVPEALSFLRKALALDPTSLDANFHFLKTLLLLGGKDAEESALSPAVDRLIKAIRASPTTHEHHSAVPAGETAPFAEPLPTLSPAYNMLIRALERLNRIDEALELAREWSYRVHADAVAHFTVGRLQLKYEKDAAEAVEALRTALDLDPSRPETCYQMALAQFRLNNLEEARDYAEQALKAQTKVEKRVRENVNRQLMQQSMDLAAQRAEAEMEEAMRSDVAPAAPPAAVASTAAAPPANYIVHNPVAGAHLLLAQVLARQGDVDHALQEVERYVEAKPTNPEGLILQARLLQQQGRNLEAYATFADLLRLWRRRVLASATSGAAAKKKGPRKAYFDAHPKEAALLANIDQTCAPANIDAAAKEKLLQVPEFKQMCEQLNKLKSIN